MIDEAIDLVGAAVKKNAEEQVGSIEPQRRGCHQMNVRRVFVLAPPDKVHLSLICSYPA